MNVLIDIFSVKIIPNQQERVFFRKEIIFLLINQDQHNFDKIVPWTGVENAIATGNTNVKSFIIYRAILFNQLVHFSQSVFCPAEGIFLASRPLLPQGKDCYLVSMDWSIYPQF